MKKIQRNEIKELHEYRKLRDDYRKRIQKIKAPRRLTIGPYLYFLFENKDTMLYQVQEMIFAESLKKEEEILHEIETYNPMITSHEEIKATLLVTFDNPTVRKVKLAELRGLEKEIYLVINKTIEIKAKYDVEQINEEKISAVQFLSFPLEKHREAFLDSESVELVTKHPACSYRGLLSTTELEALKEDIQ